MPIYEYRCNACGYTLDALQKVSDEPLKECPDCEEPELRRLVSAPFFRLKGAGWYETDFKSDKERKRNLVDDGDGKPKEKAKEKDKGDGKAGADSKKSDAKSGSDKKESSTTKASSDAVA